MLFIHNHVRNDYNIEFITKNIQNTVKNYDGSMFPPWPLDKTTPKLYQKMRD